MTPAVFTLLFYSFLLRDLLSTYYVQSTVDVMGKKVFPLSRGAYSLARDTDFN